MNPETFIWPAKELALDSPAPCFICGRYTLNLDPNFDAPFCDSIACNETIEAEIEAAYAAYDRWDSEGGYVW